MIITFTVSGSFEGDAEGPLRIMRRALMDSGLFLQGEIQRRTPVYTGTLRRSVATKAEDDGLTVRVFPGVESAQYAQPVELGARPHFPPVAPLELWVRRKLDVEPKKVRQVAFAIARKIARKGTEGQYMFQRAWDESLPIVMRRIEQAEDEIGREYGGA